MSYFRSKGSLLVGKETTHGQEASTINIVLGDYQSIDAQDTREPIESLSIETQATKHLLNGLLNPALDVEMGLVNGRIFYYALGSENVSGTGPYTHTLTPSDELPSLTMERIVTDETTWSTKYLGMKLNELTVTAALGEIVRATCTFVGTDIKKETTSVGSPAGLSEEPFKFSDCTLTMNSVDYAGRVKSFELKITRDCEAVGTCGQDHPAFVSEGHRRYELTAELVMTGSELFDLFYNSTEFSLTFKLIKTASSDEITVTINKCRVFEHQMPLSIDNKEIAVTLPILVEGDITVTVIDSFSAYA